jgi:hypothetical protein
MQLHCVYICVMKLAVKSGRLDQIGMTASIACAIHCAALPVVATTLPLIGMEFLANLWVEVFMIIFSLTIGAISMLGTYRQHRKMTPIIVLVIGFLLISIGHFLWHDMEAILIPLGGFTIAGAHFINWKLMRACTRCYCSKSEDENK